MVVLRTGAGQSGGYDELLMRVRDAVLSGHKPPARPRSVIAQSWQRVQRMGVPIGTFGAQLTRRSSPSRPAEISDPIDVSLLTEGKIPLPSRLSLASFVPLLNRSLRPILDNDVLLLALADPTGNLVVREGGPELEEQADDLGFRPGNSWSEWSVGTNGIGTALMERRPVQVHGAEHYCQTQLGWSCASAPVTDVRTGQPLGVIDLSTMNMRAHPTMLSLVTSLAGEVEFAIRQAHMMSLNQLRMANWMGASKLNGAWLIVDSYGWVALSNGLVPPKQITVPDNLDGEAIIPEIGVVYVHPIMDGYLIELIDRAVELPVTLTMSIGVDLRGTIAIHRGAAEWLHTLTPRQTSIVQYLALHPEGSSAVQIAVALYGSAQSEGSVRSEISRMKRVIGAFITPKPYRFSVSIEVFTAVDRTSSPQPVDR